MEVEWAWWGLSVECEPYIFFSPGGYRSYVFWGVRHASSPIPITLTKKQLGPPKIWRIGTTRSVIPAVATAGVEIRGARDRLSSLVRNIPFLRVESNVVRRYWFMLWWVTMGGYWGLLLFKINTAPLRAGFRIWNLFLGSGRRTCMYTLELSATPCNLDLGRVII